MNKGLLYLGLKARAEKVILDTMNIEDEIVADLDVLERRIANKDKSIEDKEKTILLAGELLVKSAVAETDAKKQLGIIASFREK